MRCLFHTTYYILHTTFVFLNFTFTGNKRKCFYVINSHLLVLFPFFFSTYFSILILPSMMPLIVLRLQHFNLSLQHILFFISMIIVFIAAWFAYISCLKPIITLWYVNVTFTLYLVLICCSTSFQMFTEYLQSHRRCLQSSMFMLHLSHQFNF